MGKQKRKGDQTPDKAATPVPSSAGVTDENGHVNQIITNVLSGEDIDSLAVNIDELQKVFNGFFSLTFIASICTICNMPLCNQSEWGPTPTVMMIMLLLE